MSWVSYQEDNLDAGSPRYFRPPSHRSSKPSRKTPKPSPDIRQGVPVNPQDVPGVKTRREPVKPVAKKRFLASLASLFWVAYYVLRCQS